MATTMVMGNVMAIVKANGCEARQSSLLHVLLALSIDNGDDNDCGCGYIVMAIVIALVMVIPLITMVLVHDRILIEADAMTTAMKTTTAITMVMVKS